MRSEPVDLTYTVQDCILEYIYKTYGIYLYDETDPESAWTLNPRLQGREETEHRFLNTTFKVTFTYRGKRCLVCKTPDRHCSIWREPSRKGRPR